MPCAGSLRIPNAYYGWRSRGNENPVQLRQLLRPRDLALRHCGGSPSLRVWALTCTAGLRPPLAAGTAGVGGARGPRSVVFPASVNLFLESHYGTRHAGKRWRVGRERSVPLGSVIFWLNLWLDKEDANDA